MSDSDFNTPPAFLDVVRKLTVDATHAIDRGIGLDPCSNETSLVQARTSYGIAENGLSHWWRGHGLVFMNPPHSMSPHNIEPWIKKAYVEFLVAETTPEIAADQFVGLLPSKTGPEWFQDHASNFPAKCFLRGRLKFWQNGVETKGPGKFDSLVVYAGPRVDLFLELFAPLGWCTR